MEPGACPAPRVSGRVVGAGSRGAGLGAGQGKLRPAGGGAVSHPLPRAPAPPFNRPAPPGAFCPGGAELLALANYWRSAADTSTFYSCKAAGVCRAGPAAGDAACVAGQQGPLCDVCEDGWFKFSGLCRCRGAAGRVCLRLRSCNRAAQAVAVCPAAMATLVTLLISVCAPARPPARPQGVQRRRAGHGDAGAGPAGGGAAGGGPVCA